MSALKLVHDADDDTFAVSEEQLLDANSESHLRSFFDRVARLTEEKKGISDDIKDVWNEARAAGFDVKIAKQTYVLWNMNPDDRREMESKLDLYKAALGLD